MVTINKILWLSKDALEADVTITDGEFEIKCFSQPLKYELNNKINEPLCCYNVKNIVKTLDNEFVVSKLSEYFAYNMTGMVVDKKNGIIKVGKISLQIETILMPGDINDGDFISFYCQRLDMM